MDPTVSQISAERPAAPPVGGGQRLVVGAVVVALAIAAGAYLWWREGRGSAPPVTTGTADAPPVSPTPPPVAAAEPAPPAILHPIEQAAVVTQGAQAASPSGPDSADAALRRALGELLGSKAMLAMVHTDDFVRRVVATIDNLDRAHAAPRLWPVVPAPGRFATVRGGDGAEQIAPANTSRYAPFVAFIESIDTARAAALYVQWYPLFQQAYRELGYPQGYFNDRLVQVIDRLLASPEVAPPIAVRLTEVKGPIASERPWVRYEFADPALESLPAGSKMLVRMGPAQSQRLKTKLAAFRAAIVRAVPAARQP
ncbi:MAG: DUF3014 domain-containing protein [Aquincola sp.]|nr:DUF3014 domain-containing protein [Aquincola sp.]MDH4287668.1 DUF3014 domain-containing protein [Aquincola sp.]MDH5328335.1 DUF3014 domain-containing protein [Aquincola sp.]